MRIRRILKLVDSLTALLAIVLALFTYYENEAFREETVVEGVVTKKAYESSEHESFMRIIIIAMTLLLDVLVVTHYFFYLRKLKIEVRAKHSDTLYSSRLINWMMAELIVCSIITPPYVDVSFSGTMLDGSYTYSLNDIVTVITFIKSYVVLRLYYHYSRWTTPEAEELCKQ